MFRRNDPNVLRIRAKAQGFRQTHKSTLRSGGGIEIVSECEWVWTFGFVVANAVLRVTSKLHLAFSKSGMALKPKDISFR